MEVVDLQAAIAAADAVDVTDAIRELHALECAVRHAQLRFIAAAHASEAWMIDGAGSFEMWLVGALRMNYATAKTLVTVAIALPELPAIAEVFAEGLISWDQLVLVCRLAKHSTDADWAEKIGGYSVADLRRELRATKAREQNDSAETTQQYFSITRVSESHYRLRGRLNLDNGAVLAAAVRALSERQCADISQNDYIPAPQRDADALVELASQSLSEDFDGHQALVSVDVDLRELDMANGIGEIDGAVVNAELIRRLLCDARVQVTASLDGVPLGVSRQSRSLPSSLRRLVKKRDRWCRFPGCERTRWVHVHHVKHWADGGPTNVDNMVLLCQQHHRLLHEGNWHIEGRLDRAVRFVMPDRRHLLSPPRRLTPETRELFGGWLEANPRVGR